jgi:hypothetical protein
MLKPVASKSISSFSLLMLLIQSFSASSFNFDKVFYSGNYFIKDFYSLIFKIYLEFKPLPSPE